MIYFKCTLQLKFTKNKNSICLLQLGFYNRLDRKTYETKFPTQVIFLSRIP